MDNKEFLLEQKHLKKCMELIEEHIETYSEQLKKSKEETKEMYDNYRSDNPELHNELVISLDWQSQLERTLKQNLLAKEKAYFGRIDYVEYGEIPGNQNKEEEKREVFSLYIGKHGIMRDVSHPLIIDWRAPVASIYYDSDMGESSYLSPMENPIYVNLQLKRTFEIEQGRLIDYYDTDVITNDEFLIKYLSKNKEVVLGEIIATIQKEQNEIIRDTPWHSILVQGVAGSGKTTVAMHRISYLLYNYKEKFHSDELYIIGSNKMLLNYITGVLPNLDVYNVNQMTMAEFFLSLLGKDFNIKKKKLNLTDIYSKKGLKEERTTNHNYGQKSALITVETLICFMNEFEKQLIVKEEVYYNEKVIYQTEDILQFLSSFPNMSIEEKIELLNKRVEMKVKNECLKEDLEREKIKEEIKPYKNYFGKKTIKVDLLSIYLDFLKKQNEAIIVEQILKGEIDLYDLAMLSYIKKRIKKSKDFSFVQHIVIDEAQDFGISIFGVLKHLFPDSTYTIMGDTSQNIYYNTGMNDWSQLREQVFSPQKDKFYVLAKSYRNTVEISNYASCILKKCSFETYQIEPVIRHGKPVLEQQVTTDKELVNRTVEFINDAKKQKFDTIAIICRTVEEAEQVQKWLSNYCEVIGISKEKEMTFVNGVMVLPIHMTKGLEFDAVLLWNPDTNAYPNTDADAKLLYVAITRALHKLNIVYKGELSKLLK